MKNEDYERIIQKALVEIKTLKKELQQKQQSIAIIGMSCRFPEDCKIYDGSFWEFLKDGRNAIHFVA